MKNIFKEKLKILGPLKQMFFKNSFKKQFFKFVL